MSHGVEHYFRERARNDRRVSLVTLSVSLVLWVIQMVLLVPPVQRALKEQILEGPLSPRRFGFEGPDQYVRRITLETLGPPGPRPGRPTMIQRSAFSVKGGRSEGRSSDDPHARPDTRPRGLGPGESTQDLVARARIIYGGSAPVIRSEDLIVERLVRPTYPQEAQDRNIEGMVALVALVDTTGTVASVNLMSSTGARVLEEAAKAAARKSRFRPYRVDGRATEVYAVFRYNFTLYY
jgi:TonB family protein